MKNDTIWIVTAEETTRGGRARELDIENLSANVNSFLEKISGILDKTPEKIGKFTFIEFEITAEISAKGMLTILGSGGEAGAKGGLKFVFHRAKDEK